MKTIIRADVVPNPVSDADFRELAAERAARFGTSVTEKGLEMLHEMSLHELPPVLDTLMFDHGNDLRRGDCDRGRPTGAGNVCWSYGAEQVGKIQYFPSKMRASGSAYQPGRMGLRATLEAIVVAPA